MPATPLQRFLDACKNDKVSVLQELIRDGFNAFTYDDNLGLYYTAKYNAFRVAFKLLRIPAVCNLEATTYNCLAAALKFESTEVAYHIIQQLKKACITIPEFLLQEYLTLIAKSDVFMSEGLVFTDRRHSHNSDSSASTQSGNVHVPRRSAFEMFSPRLTDRSEQETTKRTRFGLFSGCM